MEMLNRFFRDEEGANLVEYALLVTLIALVVFVGVGALGTGLNTWFTNMGATVNKWAANAAK